MTRYPKQQSIVSNDISGKNHLLTNSRTLTPATKRKRRRKHYSVLQEKNKLVIKIVNSEPKENVKPNRKGESEDNENKEADVKVMPKRSFLAGLLNARKARGRRKEKIRTKERIRRKELKKKRKKNSLHHSGYGWVLDSKYKFNEGAKSDETQVGSEDFRTEKFEEKCGEILSDAPNRNVAAKESIEENPVPKMLPAELKSDSEVDIENFKNGNEEKNVDKNRDVTKSYVLLETMNDKAENSKKSNVKRRKFEPRKNCGKRVRFQKTVKEKFYESGEEFYEDEPYARLSVRNEYFKQWNYEQELEEEEKGEGDEEKLKFKKHDETKLLKKKPKNYLVNYLNKKNKKDEHLSAAQPSAPERGACERDDKCVSNFDLSSGIGEFYT